MALVTPGTYSMAALMSEITNDPKGLGYSSQSGNADSIAVLMNTSPEPIATGQQEQIYRNYADTRDLMAGIVLSEFTALTQANQVKTGDSNLRTQIGSVFAAGTTSRTNLTNAAQKNASRSEALWGDGFRVTAQQVALALHPEEQGA
jgi:hypothetical protein